MNSRKVAILPLSALARTNTQELLAAAVRKLAETPVPVEIPAALPVYRPAEDPRDFRLAHEGEHRWRLAGASLERAASMTFWEHDGSVRRFQKLMKSLGVDDALRKAGVEEGDTVAIGDFELDWQD
jgi:GTP-binding protein